MNIHYPATRIVVAGVTQNGKSTFIERLVRTSKSQKVIIYDWQSFEFALERLKIEPVTEWKRFAELWESPQRIICFDPCNGPEEDFSDINEFILEANSNCRFEVDLIGDELGQVFGHGKLPEFVKRGWVAGRREAQLNIIWACHQLNEVHYSMRNHVTEIACFRQNDKLALEAVEQFRLHESGHNVMDLEVGEFLYRDVKNNSAPIKKHLFKKVVDVSAKSDLK